MLLTGETGTGKDLAAKAIHYNSGRSTRSFVNITCSALPEQLLEHVRQDSARREVGGFDRRVDTEQEGDAFPSGVPPLDEQDCRLARPQRLAQLDAVVLGAVEPQCLGAHALRELAGQDAHPDQVGPVDSLESTRDDRANAEHIGLLTVPIMSGDHYAGFLPIREVTRQVRGTGPAVIERLDRQRAIKVTANAEGRPLGDVVTEMLQVLGEEDLPDGVTLQLEGDAKMMLESNSNLLLAMLLGVLFIYIVLASQFAYLSHAAKRFRKHVKSFTFSTGGIVLASQFS